MILDAKSLSAPETNPPAGVVGGAVVGGEVVGGEVCGGAGEGDAVVGADAAGDVVVVAIVVVVEVVVVDVALDTASSVRARSSSGSVGETPDSTRAEKSGASVVVVIGCATAR